MRSVPRLCDFNPGICLTTEEKHGKTSVRVVKECCYPPYPHLHYYISLSHPDSTKPTRTQPYTLQNIQNHTVQLQFEDNSKICRENSIFIKIRQEERVLYMKTSMFLIISRSVLLRMKSVSKKSWELHSHSTQKSAVLIYFAEEAWCYASDKSCTENRNTFYVQ